MLKDERKTLRLLCLHSKETILGCQGTTHKKRGQWKEKQLVWFIKDNKIEVEVINKRDNGDRNITREGTS